MRVIHRAGWLYAVTLLVLLATGSVSVASPLQPTPPPPATGNNAGTPAATTPTRSVTNGAGGTTSGGRADVVTTGDGFDVTVGSPSGVVDFDVRNTSTGPAAPKCTQRKAIAVGNDTVDLMRTNPRTGEIEEGYLRKCPGQAGSCGCGSPSRSMSKN